MGARPAYINLLLVLAPLTVLDVCLVSLEDWPHEHHVWWTWEQTLDRAAAGYTSLPRFDANRREFDHWGGEMEYGAMGFMEWYDEPYWPGGDPQLSENNPLPPKVRRVQTVGIDKGVLILLPIPLWIVWFWMWGRHAARQPSVRPPGCSSTRSPARHRQAPPARPAPEI